MVDARTPAWKGTVWKATASWAAMRPRQTRRNVFILGQS